MWTSENISSQSGKTAIVTGSNSGIGFEIARALYGHGAQVIIAARSVEKVEAAIIKLKQQGGTGSLHAMELDLANLEQIKGFASRFKDTFAGLDLLINNAGVMTPPASKTDDGFELQFGVNFLGHFALTGHLYPMLAARDGARIVTLSSGASNMVEAIDFDNLKFEKGYDAQREYARSKFAGLQFSIELQRRIEKAGDSVLSIAAHPGVTQSNLARYMDKQAFESAVEQFGGLMPTWQGALPALFAACDEHVQGGGYYGPDGENEMQGFPAAARINPSATNPESSAELWRYAEQSTGISFP